MSCIDTIACDTKGWDRFNDLEKEFRTYFGKFYYKTDKTFAHPLPDLFPFDSNAKYTNKLSDTADCKIFINFCSWYPLTTKEHNMSQLEDKELRRGRARNIVVTALNILSKIAYQLYNINFLFESINISKTEASMRSIFKGTNPNETPAERETEISELNLSDTSVSWRFVVHLKDMTKLTKLYLDDCKWLQDREEFVNCLVGNQFVNIEVLSLVGTTKALPPSWLREMNNSFPSLIHFYFSAPPELDSFKFVDSLTRQQIEAPALLSCGHICESRAALSGKDACPIHYNFDLQTSWIETAEATYPFYLRIAKIEKINDVYHCSYVDSKRRELGPVVLVHTTCGECYNTESLRECYDTPLHIDIPIFNHLLGKTCRGCGERFARNDMKRLFPHFIFGTYGNFKEILKITLPNKFYSWNPFKNA